MQKIFLAFALFTTASSLSGCNTVSGIGEDVQAAGGAVTKASESVQSGS